MKPVDAALLTLWLVAVVLRLQAGGGLVPLKPVDSPFPDDGEAWLLLAAEANELSGVLGVGNAEELRSAVPKNRRVLDYTGTDEPDPWPSALQHANQKGGGKPYFVYRNGNRAAEGPLPRDLREQLAVITQAMGVR